MLDIGAIFDASPNAYMVVDCELRYVAVNRAYERATGKLRDELIGSRVTDIFPHDPADPNNAQAQRLIRSIESVFASGVADTLPLIHYRIPVRGVHVDRYWSATHTPVRATDGTVELVLQHTVDVTHLHDPVQPTLQVAAGVLDRAQAVDERNTVLDRNLRELGHMLEQAPGFIAFMRGPDHVFELANAAYRRLVRGRMLLGQPVRAALPEIEPEYFELLDRVYRTGEPFVGKASRVTLQNANGQIREEFVDFVYQAVRDASGCVFGVIVFGQEITEQVRAQAELQAIFDERAQLLAAERAARADAERASLLMDQFLATVSHELRTPLTAILGWMQMLRSGMVAPDKRERALEVVERNAHVQAQLVEDLLDVSRILTGKLTIELEPTDVAGAVGAAVETVRPVADGKGVRLDVEIESTATVRGDNQRLQQVVWNLLSNAVKFTPAGGRVTLRVDRVGDHVELAVSDTGQGIAPEFLPHVFERFRQADGGSRRKLGGLGLGLSIVHHVVGAHGGTVTAASEGKGKGATFTVRLPVLAEKVVTSDKPAPISEVSLRGVRVLVVDDEEDTREFVRALLDQCSAQVIVAGNAAEALAAIQRERPDILVSDLGMPGEDGYGLIRRIRELPADRGGKTPAIALTAYARSEDRTRAMLAGFQNHVSKPVVPAELLAVVAATATR